MFYDPLEKGNEIKFLQIKKFKHIPKQLGAFKIYFHTANLKYAGGQTYTYMYIKHSKLFKELQDDLSYYFTSTRSNIYYKDIQAEKTPQLDYLLYSITFIDPKLLFTQSSKIS